MEHNLQICICITIIAAYFIIVSNSAKEFSGADSLSGDESGVQQLAKKTPILKEFDWVNNIDTDTKCAACRAFGAVLKGATAVDLTDALKKSMKKLCVKYNFGTETICDGLVDLNLPVFENMVKKKKIDSCDICKTVVEFLKCCDGGPNVEWTVPLDSYGKKPKDCSAFKKGSEKKSGKNKILHITDLHMDNKYFEGSLNTSNEPVACRKNQGFANRKREAAGIYGDYHSCDMPLVTLNNTLSSIMRDHGDEILFVIVTGDLPSHAVWELTPKDVSNDIIVQTNLMYHYFGDIPVYLCLGNHDVAPSNLFPPEDVTDPNVNADWIYKLIAEHWGKSLDKEAREKIVKGGFYTTKTSFGVRIIALNSMFGYFLNWWLVQNPVDPYGQLHWLAETLFKAEKAGEKVYIIAHVPPGSSDCLSVYSRELWKILTRFHCIIPAMFVGHTHTDEQRLMYDYDDISIPILNIFNGGSITTYSFVNVNYKLYTVDTSTWEILDAESWVFDLSRAGLMPYWYKLYSFKEAYGLKDLSPKSMDSWVQQMVNDKNVLLKYNKFYGKGANTKFVDDCDTVCLKKRFCDIVTSNYSVTTKCDLLKKEMKY